MTRRDSLRALYEAVKAGTICNDDAIISAKDLAMIEAVFPMTGDDNLPELVGLALEGSLDAALALHNAVLPGSVARLQFGGKSAGVTVCHCTVEDWDSGEEVDANNVSDPARALLLADLAAMIEGEG
jgi:hypothetical protein